MFDTPESTPFVGVRRRLDDGSWSLDWQSDSGPAWSRAGLSRSAHHLHTDPGTQQ